MTQLARIARELYGLFVDDASAAIATLAWLAAIWLLHACLPSQDALLPYVLAAGLVLLLAQTTLRAAKRRSRGR